MTSNAQLCPGVLTQWINLMNEMRHCVMNCCFTVAVNKERVRWEILYFTLVPSFILLSCLNQGLSTLWELIPHSPLLISFIKNATALLLQASSHIIQQFFNKTNLYWDIWHWFRLTDRSVTSVLRFTRVSSSVHEWDAFVWRSSLSGTVAPTARYLRP